MIRAMAVEFTDFGILHYLDPGEGTYRPGDLVLYPTESGTEVCRVVWAPETLSGVDRDARIPLCAGMAGEQDLVRDRRHRAKRAEIERVAVELIAGQGLPMKVLGVDYCDDDGELAAIYFRAPGRVDFRALVSELARTLHARIDLRQVGSRDAARLIGGVGNCGRELCCTTWLDTVEPVSPRLAKEQGLSPNPLQISGACGRLLCCLKYEHPLYADFVRRAPDVGQEVTTPTGDGVVVGHSVPEDAVRVRTEDGIQTCPLASVCVKRPQRRQPTP